VISELAYSELSDLEKQKLDLILKPFEQQLSHFEKQSLKKQPYRLSLLAKTSVLPDLWSRESFSHLCARLKIPAIPLPAALLQGNMGPWHYEDTPYFSNREQPSDAQAVGMLSTIIPALESEYKNLKRNHNHHEHITRGLLIVFLAHLVADAHQPLHGLSRISNGVSDQGGNRFCLRKKRHQCQLNLHAYWDRGGFWLKEKHSVPEAVGVLKHHYSQQNTATVLAIQDPKAWLQEDYAFAHFVYSTRENRMPTRDYQEKTQDIAQKRLAMAGYRLAALLKELLHAH
jgi:hypothetical protein